MGKATKLSLTELVGQYRNIFPLAFSTLTSLPFVNAEKGYEQYLSPLISDSVDKSIELLGVNIYQDHNTDAV